MMTPEELRKRFMYHAPKGDQAERYGNIRGSFGALASQIDMTVPDSRVKATAPLRFRFPFMTEAEIEAALDTTTDPFEAVVLAAYDFIQWDATYEGGGMTGVQEGLRRSKQRLREAVDRARRRP